MKKHGFFTIFQGFLGNHGVYLIHPPHTPPQVMCRPTLDRRAFDADGAARAAMGRSDLEKGKTGDPTGSTTGRFSTRVDTCRHFV